MAVLPLGRWLMLYKASVLLLLCGLMFGQETYIQKRERFAHAIALTEGCYVRGSIPNRYNNCGDLKRMTTGGKYPEQAGVGKGGHIIFRTKEAGWTALLHQIDKMTSGESLLYRQEMTLQQVGKLYAQNSRRWANNMAKYLGVPPSTTLGEYFELPPRVTIKFDGRMP